MSGVVPYNVQPSWKSLMASTNSISRNVLLLGKSGSGKSSLGNALLHQRAFSVSSGISSATEQFQLSRGLHTEGEPCLTVVDSPDLITASPCDSRSELISTVRQSLEAAFQMCPNEGFHLVVLTVRLDVRFTEEERQTLSCIADALGDGLAKVGVVAFTHGDCVENDEAKFRALVGKIRSESHMSLGALIDRCGGRYCMVDGGPKCEPGVQQNQVQKLLEMLDAATVQPLRWSEVSAAGWKDAWMKRVVTGVAVAAASVCIVGALGGILLYCGCVLITSVMPEPPYPCNRSNWYFNNDSSIFGPWE